MSRNEIERLIEAGAIVAPGADGDTVDQITARHYRHPALGERAVVTLVPGTLGPAEDLAMEFLGFEAGAEPVVVGSGRRQALGFPAWAVINDPVNGHHALALVKDIERLARQARSKPGQARDGFEALGERLSRAVPHFLPTFYEQVGRAFVAADNRQIAATMFGRAREAERVHALPIDEDRQRDVFLEFAFSGALTAKSLTQHAKDLALRAEPVAAYELFLRICAERVAGGLPPYSGMADDLRRLAKAAGLPIAEQDERVISGLLDSPALPHAPLAFWKAYTPALTRLAQADVAVRARLLDLLPASEQPGTEDLWFDLLASTGALRGLIEVDDGPAVGRPRDGAAGWLARVVRWQGRGWGNSNGSKRVLDVVSEMAPRLRAEGTALKVLDSNIWRVDLDLIDLCLSLDLEVVVPADLRLLPLTGWLAKDAAGRRDLATLAGTDWAREALIQGLGDALTRMVGSSWYYHRPSVVPLAAVQPLLDNAGTQQIVWLWLERLAESAEGSALPQLEDTLSWLVPAALDVVLGVNPPAAARLRGVDVAGSLARTLRIGLFDELTWPALEQAVAEYPPPVVPTTLYRNTSSQIQFQVGDSWPMLILTSPARVTVVGPDGVLMRHDVRFPAARPIGGGTVTADYVDGKLLVCWSSSAGNTGYWDAHPDAVFDVKDEWLQHYRRPGAGGQPLPGGGRTGGGRPLLPGDTTFTPIKPVAGDGEHWWRWSDSGWREYDPQTGDAGRPSRPAFFEAALARGDDAELLDSWCRLAPIPAGLEHTPLGTADGLLGWRVVRLPDGGRLGESITGAVLRVSPEYVARHAGFEPVGLLQLPARASALGVLADHWWTHLTAGDVVGSRIQAGGVDQPYARGTALVPPVSHWHALRPRDEPGSAVLRALTDAQSQALLKAAEQVPDKQSLDATVTRCLPGITDPKLIAGVAGVLEIAVGLARQVQALPAAASVSSEPVSAIAPAQSLPDDQLSTALAGLTGRSGGFGYYPSSQSNSALENLRAVVALLANPPKQNLLNRLGLARASNQSADLPSSRVEWTAVIGGLGALALRAASAATAQEDRAALTALLTEVQGTPLAEPDGRWREAVLSGARNEDLDTGSSLPTSTGTAVVVGKLGWRYDQKPELRVLEHSPSGRFGAVPGYAVTSSRVSSGWGGAARIAEFLELLSARGPAPWRPEAVDTLVAATGMSRAEAALLLAGLPGGHAREHNFLDKQTRETLGLKVAEAAAAQPTFRKMDNDDRLLLLGLAMPERPADYWDHGPDVEALAAGWIRMFGRRAMIPGQLLTELAAVMSRYAHQLPISALLQGIADPASCGWLSRDRKWQIKDQQLHATGDQSGFAGYQLPSIVAALAWLAYRLPLDDPFRAQLAPALAALRQRLANPDLLVLVLGGTEIAGLRQVFGHAAAPTTPVGARRSAVTLDLGPAGVLVAGDWSDSVYVRPAFLDGPGDPLLKLSDGLYDPPSAALRILADPAFDRLIGSGPGPGVGAGSGSAASSVAEGGVVNEGGAVNQGGVVDEGGASDAGAAWAQDPLVSAPGLVPQVAAKLGVDTAAARLYLQLLALPDPSDKNVNRWNGWTAKQLKPATAALRAVGAVVDGKRSRAGRAAFLPCGWLDLPAPYPPIEVWKVTLLGLLPDGQGPLALTVPTVPVGELFQQAWERVLAGDGPRLEQFKSGRAR